MECDIGKSKVIGIRTFEVEAYKAGICLSDKDMATLFEYYSEAGGGLVKYEEVLRALVPVISCDGDL